MGVFVRAGSNERGSALLMVGLLVLALGASAGAAGNEQAAPSLKDQAATLSSTTGDTPGGEQPAAATSAPAKAPQEAQAPAPKEEAATQTGKPFTWKWDNTITYGLGSRVVGRDDRIIGLRSGGSAFSVNGDDGNLNYDTGIFTNAVKFTTEFQFDYKNFGGFVRGFGFWDAENYNGDRARIPLSQDAKDWVGLRAEFRDAFAYYRWNLGGLPGEVRAGWQVINWGESTFIQGGINAINPFDVTVLRVPGSELRDALLPVGAVKGSVKFTENASFEAFYQYTWEPVKLDPVGTYFSTTDLAGEGAVSCPQPLNTASPAYCQKVMLGFGSVPDFIQLPDGSWQNFMGPVPPSTVGVAVPKVDNQEPSDQGQYGAALRYLFDGFGGTELGLYFINYHSRLPVIMAHTGTLQGALPAVLGGKANYAGTASYYFVYPEDIQLLGASFNSQLGRTGIALQGEVSHRWRVPLLVDDVELLFASLGPLRLMPVLPGNPFAALIVAGNLFANNNQIGKFGFNEVIPGYKTFETTQVQATGTKVFGRMFGADQFTLVGEFAWDYVHGFPDPSVLRLEGPGTYTSGNPVFTAAGVQPATQCTSKENGCQGNTFPTQNSWGYVVAGRFDYNNVFASVNMIPRFSFAQDVSGTSPGPGGNFIEGRKAFTAGLGFQYQYNWEFDVSYTNFFGAALDGDPTNSVAALRTAGRYNLIGDRDFIAINVKYSFQIPF